MGLARENYGNNNSFDSWWNLIFPAIHMNKYLSLGVNSSFSDKTQTGDLERTAQKWPNRDSDNEVLLAEHAKMGIELHCTVSFLFGDFQQLGKLDTLSALFRVLNYKEHS